MQELSIIDFALGFVVGWLLFKLIQAVIAIRKIIKEIENQALVEVVKSHIHVNIEKHGDSFYLYDKETDVFIAQGKNFDELKERCQMLFKDCTVVADHSVMETMGLK